MTLCANDPTSVASGRALSSVEEHFLHTEGAAGSSPAARTTQHSITPLLHSTLHPSDPPCAESGVGLAVLQAYECKQQTSLVFLRGSDFDHAGHKLLNDHQQRL